MCTPKTGGGSSGHSFVSDPTAQKAIKNLSSVGTVVVEYGAKVAGKGNVKTLHHPEKWLRIVDETWKYYNSGQIHTIMVKRYKKGWDMQHIANTLGISFQRCYVLLNDVHRFVISSAKGYGIYQEANLKHPERVADILNVIKEKRGN